MTPEERARFVILKHIQATTAQIKLSQNDSEKILLDQFIECRNESLEEAAKVAEGYLPLDVSPDGCGGECSRDIAADIRFLKREEK